MEIIIGLVIVAGLAFYLLRKNKELDEAISEAPYKVEQPKAEWELPKVNEVESKPQEPTQKPSQEPAVEVTVKPVEAVKVTKAPKKPKVVKSEQPAKPKATNTAKPKAQPKAAAMKVVKGDAPKKAPKTKK